MSSSGILAGVEGDAVEPGAQLCLAAKVTQRFVRFEEDFLHHVLRVVVVSGHSEGQLEHLLLMTLDNFLKGVSVAVACSFYEALFVDCAVHVALFTLMTQGSGSRFANCESGSKIRAGLGEGGGGQRKAGSATETEFSKESPVSSDQELGGNKAQGSAGPGLFAKED